jgi:hypothetical protein
VRQDWRQVEQRCVLAEPGDDHESGAQFRLEKLPLRRAAVDDYTRRLGRLGQPLTGPGHLLGGITSLVRKSIPAPGDNSGTSFLRT